MTNLKVNWFWSTQAILYDYEAPLTLTTTNGSGNYVFLILDSEEEDRSDH